MNKHTLKIVFSSFLFVLVGLLLYGKTIRYELVYLDDNVWILDHQWYLKKLSNIPQFFLQHDLVSEIFYRPLIAVSLSLDAFRGGSAPQVYHVTNILIHLLNTCLLFQLFIKWGYRLSLGFWFALIFLVHPVLTQAVVWIPGRTDSLLALFVLASFRLFLNFIEKRGLIAFLAHLVFLIGALLTKETAIVVPVLCWVFLALRGDYWKVLKRQKWLIVSHVVIIVGWFWARQAILGDFRKVGVEEAARSLMGNLSAFPLYFGKIFLPVNLSVLPHVDDSRIIYGIVSFCVLLSALFIFKTARKSYIFFGFLWFFLFISPALVLSFIQHEYRLYLPIIGIFIVLAEINIVREAALKFGGWIPFVVVALLFSVVSFKYSENFRNRMVFWESAVKTSPHSPLARRNLGAMYYLDGQIDKAEVRFKEALQLNPYEAMVHNNLGLIYMNKNQNELAEKEYREEIRINPAYANVYFNLGLLYYKQGNVSSTIEAWKKTIELDDKYIEAYKNLAILYFKMNDHVNSSYYVRQLRQKGVAVPEPLLTMVEK